MGDKLEQMNGLCPNCGQTTNSSFSRLVKDACGHMKCRMCLLYEEEGCESCRKERKHCENVNFEYTEPFADTTNKAAPPEANPSTVDSAAALPLKLVMNKTVEHCSSATENIPSVQDIADNNNGGLNYNDNNQETLTELTNVRLDNSKEKFEDNDVQNSTDGKEERSSVNYENVSENKDCEAKQKKYHNRSHIIIIPGDPQKYQCVVCQKIFQNKKSIHYHNACATGIKPFKCVVCEKTFVNRSHFIYHERTHSGYKPFKCNLCDKAFPQRNKLNRHMTSHSSEKNFACSKCDKKYSKKADLQSHLYIHLEATDNKYSCKSCGKAFGNVTHLKRHSRAHSTERPHVCEHCNKSFKDKSLLVRHCKTHGKERPFTCAHCSRGFLTKSELRRHLTIHSDEKPFSCVFCKTVFRRKDNLNRHIRHHHNEDERATANQTKLNSTVTLDSKQPPDKVKPKTAKLKAKIKKPLSKSQSKAAKVAYTNSQKQINSRLDPMGNITPVIRTTREVSNAVPVINGPTITRRLTESSDLPKKTLTYMEPIPPEEAVVINKRIEAKLYPQSQIGQNYFFHGFADASDNLYSNSNSLLRSSLSFSNRPSKFGRDSNSNSDAFQYADASFENSSIVPDKNKLSSYNSKTGNVIRYEEKVQNNYVSTIKKHPSRTDLLMDY